MIEVRYQGRLGNNLFQYCLGRIIAEELGLGLRADPIPGFPNTAEHVGGLLVGGPEEILGGQKIDLAAVLADRRPRRIVLDGWFQCHQYYRPHREKIRRWLAFDSAIQIRQERPEVVVNVRRTDYVERGWALPYSFYESALERLLPQGGRTWIVTDDWRDPFFENFRRWRPRFFRGTAQEQMLFMTQATRLVMSQSTFSWWSTFLGDVAEVVCPVPSFGVWSPEGEGADTDLMETDRFICIGCRERYVPTPAESRHQAWRRFKRQVVFKLNRSFGFGLEVPPP